MKKITINCPVDDLNMKIKNGDAEINIPNYSEFLELFEVNQLIEALSSRGYVAIPEDEMPAVQRRIDFENREHFDIERRLRA